MKKIIIILVFSFFSILGVNYSQTIPPEFQEATEVYYHGLEFSSVRAFGDGFEKPQDIISRYFPDMTEYIYNRRSENNLEISFKGDFYYPKKYKSKKFIYHAEETIKNTAKMNPDKLVYHNDLDCYHLTKDSILTIINKYIKVEGQKYGFVIVIEDLNKRNRYASVWPTIFNMETGEIIFTKRYESLPGGWGPKEYWIAAVEDCLQSFANDFLKLLKDKK